MKKRTIGLLALALVFVLVICICPERASAAESRLSVDSSKVWLNGEGSITVTLKDRKKGENLSFKMSSKKAVTAEAGKWKKDKCVVTLTPLKDKNLTLTISCAGESVKVKLYMVTDRTRTGEEIYSYASAAMVEVKEYDYMDSCRISGGFFIGDGLVLTTYSAIKEGMLIKVVDYNKKEYKVTSVLGYDDNSNLALLKVKTGNKAALTFADKAVGGEILYGIGSPAGLTGSIVSGIVSNPDRVMNDNNVRYIQISMPSGVGSGGGPILNAKGRVIGIMSLTLSNAQNISFAIHNSETEAFLKAIDPDKAIPIKDFCEANEGKVIESPNDYKLCTDYSLEGNASAYSTTCPEVTGEEVYNMANGAMVDIWLVERDENGNAASEAFSGSGFFISADMVATCYHVFEGFSRYSIKIFDYAGVEYYITQMVYDKTNDIAILEVDSKEGLSKHTSLDIDADYIPAPGETVYVLGSPRGYSDSITAGITSMSTRTYKGVKYLNIDAAINPGNSGGAILNKYGKVVAVTSKTMNEDVAQRQSLGVLISYLKEL